MVNRLRRLFAPTLDEREEDRKRLLKIFNEQAQDRGCTTCSHCVHIQSYPRFVTAEECKCDAGLECDTVLFSVKNCPKWRKENFV